MQPHQGGQCRVPQHITSTQAETLTGQAEHNPTVSNHSLHESQSCTQQPLRSYTTKPLPPTAKSAETLPQTQTPNTPGTSHQSWCTTTVTWEPAGALAAATLLSNAPAAAASSAAAAVPSAVAVRAAAFGIEPQSAAGSCRCVS